MDITSDKSEDLIPFSDENVGAPVAFQNYVLFNSPVSGIDNIYAVDLDTLERFQVTSSKYGAFNAAVSQDGRMLYYSDQSRDGFNVVSAPFNPQLWKKTQLVSESNLSFHHLVEQEGRPELFNTITNQDFKSKRYHRASGMINPHSWRSPIPELIVNGQAWNCIPGYSQHHFDRCGIYF